MVATRRSAGKHIDVELSDNGKELQKVIPIEKQRQLQMKQHQSSPKKETRGRKKKDRNLDELGTSVNSSESSSSSPSIKSHPRSPLTDAAAAPLLSSELKPGDGKEKFMMQQMPLYSNNNNIIIIIVNLTNNNKIERNRT